MDNDICPFMNKAYDCLNCDGHREDWTGKGEHSVHMGHSVSGVLRRTQTMKEWNGMSSYITKDDGSAMSGEEIKLEFMRMDAKGIKTFPMGKCSRWCFRNGCQGHVGIE